MLKELVVVCALANGAELAVPPGWTVEKVRAGGESSSGTFLLNTPAVYCPGGCPPPPPPRTEVHLRRAIGEHDREVTMPAGCEVRVKIGGTSGGTRGSDEP